MAEKATTKRPQLKNEHTLIEFLCFYLLHLHINNNLNDCAGNIDIKKTTNLTLICSTAALFVAFIALYDNL